MVNGFVMFISLCFLASWIPAHYKRRLVGFGFFTDVAVHVMLQSLFGGDGDGRIAMLFAGVLFNVAMHTYRKLYGYEKLVNFEWVRYPGALTRI